MKMLKMRINGVEIPRRELNSRFRRPDPGKLSVMDTTDQGLHRSVKMAIFAWEIESLGAATLYDARLLWWSNGRFVLTGFERIRNEQQQLVDVAQSWLIYADGEPPPMPEGR